MSCTVFRQIPVKNMLKLCVSAEMMNDEKTVSYDTTYSLSMETVGTFEILYFVNSVA